MVATVKSVAPAASDLRSEFEADVIAGLSADPKSIPPKYFYDAEGSRLFDEITRTPEYYLTRTATAILKDHVRELNELVPQSAALVEFGSGACTKVQTLLDNIPAIVAYLPVDISGDFLKAQVERVSAAYPRLTVHPVVADFTKPFELPAEFAQMPKTGFFPGSTFGSFEPHDAVTFMRHAAHTIGKGGLLAIGVDLVKDPAVLNAAYNDAAGLTDKFNLNLLRRINRELGGNFDLQAFEHHAVYNRERRRIEMHLASKKRQKVTVAGRMFSFRAGETILTENSYKYTQGSFAALARGCGWTPEIAWTDPAELFAVHALRTR
ncbi:MAG TPA: L-histidine N(alpha)-methyltransferase [Pseudorhodoplanes sp.]|nr:L-histidine N(alpha)-methyltransferase [Pseudorhodoplanes sp.]